MTKSTSHKNGAQATAQKNAFNIRIKLKSHPKDANDSKRQLLDRVDKYLHTQCVEADVKFIWPECESMRSKDEDLVKRDIRRKMIRRMLKMKKTLAKVVLRSNI